jgi:hypothetical protein
MIFRHLVIDTVHAAAINTPCWRSTRYAGAQYQDRLRAPVATSTSIQPGAQAGKTTGKDKHTWSSID